MSVPQSTEILADRVRFDIIAERNGVEWRVWTDGGIVAWTGTRNGEVVDRGHIPAMLFRLAAHTLADYCEDKAIEAGEDGDTFYTMVHDSLKTPVSLAMAHPYWAQPDDERNDLRFGFASVAVNTSIDKQPEGLKSREDYKMSKDEAAAGTFYDRCQIVEDRRFEDNGETSTWWAVRTPDGQMYLDENSDEWKPMPQMMAGWFMSKAAALAALHDAEKLNEWGEGRTRLTAASVVPAGHVRLPDGRDVKISQAGMDVLVRIADNPGNPFGAYITAGILDWNPPQEAKS